ncbi:MAG: thioesterase family protein [Anaerolineae bacterium]|nr:thioesterase family protein [Anaerolineae bacterium]HOV47498.1 thioesterase family protein [Anaerolineae bacterium]HRT31262.1 thioesterase family protein [Anaerolineae bacterium]HXK43457.1 thioesterase family protein [Anaerolineae bacterium]
MPLEPGLIGEIHHVVADADTAAAYGSGLVPVLSTPHLVALMENAAQQIIQPFLAPGQTAVGVCIEMQHLAATPVGMEVTVRAELVSVERRRLRFTIEAWDAVERIGTAVHERVLIDREHFMARVAQKREGAANQPG